MKKLFSTPIRAAASTVCIVLIVLAVTVIVGLTLKHNSEMNLAQSGNATLNGAGAKQSDSAYIADNKSDTESTSPESGQPADSSNANGSESNKTENQAATDTSNSSQAKKISLEEAKAAALADAGLSESDVTYTKAKSDYDDRVEVYDIEFYTTDTEYEYEIKASDGTVYKKEKESIRNGGNTQNGNANTGNNTQNPSNNYIGLERAKEIALNYAKLTGSDVQFSKAEQETDNGKVEYEIEFYYNGKKYELTVDALSGDVTGYSVESASAQNNNQTNTNVNNPSNQTNNNNNNPSNQTNNNTNKPSNQTNTQTNGSNQKISLEDAKAIALADAGLSESNVTYTKTKSDYDNRVEVYDIEFYTTDTKYDYEIKASDGTIYEKETKRINVEKKPETNNSDNQSNGYIGVDRAKEIALNHAKLKESDVRFSKAKLERDDGKSEYEIEFDYGKTEYEYTIDAYSGKITDYDIDTD